MWRPGRTDSLIAILPQRVDAVIPQGVGGVVPLHDVRLHAARDMQQNLTDHYRVAAVKGTRGLCTCAWPLVLLLFFFWFAFSCFIYVFVFS